MWWEWKGDSGKEGYKRDVCACVYTFKVEWNLLKLSVMEHAQLNCVLNGNKVELKEGKELWICWKNEKNNVTHVFNLVGILCEQLFELLNFTFVWNWNIILIFLLGWFLFSTRVSHFSKINFKIQFL